MLRASSDDLEVNGVIGDWCISPGESYIWLRYPTGSDRGDIVVLPLLPVKSNGWDWNHNREAPTLTPSIRIMGLDGQPDIWHGYLTDGKLVSV